jgi:predicted MFS family arabinose efflux permease
MAVPALAFAGSWRVAAALLLAERVGRAIRKPTVEAMLSYTTGELGKGWVYALNTALDELGATVGPLLIALILFLRGNYRTGFATLVVSAVLALGALTAARVVFPLPADLEKGRTATAKGFTRAYWLYMLAAACFAAGLMSFEFISFHLSSTNVVTGQWIPLFLALSTGCGVLASLILGKLYDRKGLPVVIGAVLVSSLFSPLVFFGGFVPALVGLLLWGVGYATQDTLFKALIAGVLPEGKRNAAFGIFYAGYGVGWLVGSTAAGLLYGWSRLAVVVFAMAAQVISLPVFIAAGRASRSLGAGPEA